MEGAVPSTAIGTKILVSGAALALVGASTLIYSMVQRKADERKARKILRSKTK